MSTLTVTLPDPLAARLEREATRRRVPADTIIRQALEQAIPSDEASESAPIFGRLSRLIVNDPASPTDLATNPAHMESLGVSRSA